MSNNLRKINSEERKENEGKICPFISNKEINGKFARKKVDEKKEEIKKEMFNS